MKQAVIAEQWKQRWQVVVTFIVVIAFLFLALIFLSAHNVPTPAAIARFRFFVDPSSITTNGKPVSLLSSITYVMEFCPLKAGTMTRDLVLSSSLIFNLVTKQSNNFVHFASLVLKERHSY